MLRDVVAEGDRFGHGRGPRRAADQPRVRLGQPDRSAPRGWRALGRGRRRAREPARRAGRRGPPRVLPERRRQPARHVRRVAPRAVPGRAAARGRVPGRSTSSRWPTGCGPSSATTSPRSRRASGATSDVVRSSSDDLGRIGVHFDTWFSERTLHERGEVDARARPQLAARGATFEHDGATWLRTDGLRRPARPRPREVRRLDDLPLQRPRLPRGQVRPRLDAPHRHLGRRPPRPGEVAAGRARGARPPGGRARGAARPAREAGARRRAGADVEAGREHHHARRHPRRGRPRRLPAHVPAAEHRHHADLRPRRRDRAVDGEPRLLRAVRARPHRVDRPAGRASAASRALPILDDEPGTARARARARPAPLARACTPRSSQRGRRAAARRTASRPGCATSRRASTASTATAA